MPQMYTRPQSLALQGEEGIGEAQGTLPKHDGREEESSRTTTSIEKPLWPLLKHMSRCDGAAALGGLKQHCLEVVETACNRGADQGSKRTQVNVVLE